MNNKFSSNLIAVISGMLVFGTDLFTQIPSLNRLGITLFGGYIFLSLLHAWKIAKGLFANLTSIIILWLLPLMLVSSILLAILVGFAISLPQFIRSIVKYRSSKYIFS